MRGEMLMANWLKQLADWYDRLTWRQLQLAGHIIALVVTLAWIALLVVAGWFAAKTFLMDVKP